MEVAGDQGLLVVNLESCISSTGMKMYANVVQFDCLVVTVHAHVIWIYSFLIFRSCDLWNTESIPSA
jgi:hypothetical protein